MGYNSIKLYGKQICDYVHIQSSPINNDDFKLVASEPSGWGSSTLMLSKYDNNLAAGNSALTDNIVGYEIRRKKGSELHTEYVGTIEKSNLGENKNFIIDYAVANNAGYSYYLYPSSKVSGSGVLLNPIITDEIKTDWAYWSLIIVDETNEENVFYLNKIFKFELNIQEEDMSNNADVTITKNFTKYPTVQHTTSNYWSSSLSALCGYISCDDVEYVQTVNMIEELKSLSSDTRRKFLKDIDGNIWEVEIVAPINISTDTTVIQRVKTAKISWAEVGDATGVSIINNPELPTVSWLLTESGEAVPYIKYIWDDNYKWNDSYKWTARDDMLETTVSNMGRNLFSKDGEE